MHPDRTRDNYTKEAPNRMPTTGATKKGRHMPETITVYVDEYEQLKKDQEELKALKDGKHDYLVVLTDSKYLAYMRRDEVLAHLEAGGVANWQGYEGAMSDYWKANVPLPTKCIRSSEMKRRKYKILASKIDEVIVVTCISVGLGIVNLILLLLFMGRLCK
jgi:hypothetical protein